jgi:hypothetical protein
MGVDGTSTRTCARCLPSCIANGHGGILADSVRTPDGHRADPVMSSLLKDQNATELVRRIATDELLHQQLGLGCRDSARDRSRLVRAALGTRHCPCGADEALGLTESVWR